MSLAVIESTLPNGLHDATIISLKIDLCQQQVDVCIEFVVGLPTEDRESRDRRSRGNLSFRGVKLAFIEEPDLDSEFRSKGPLSFVLTEDEIGSISEQLIKRIEGKHHSYVFFIQEWMSSIKIIAADVDFQIEDQIKGK